MKKVIYIIVLALFTGILINACTNANENNNQKVETKIADSATVIETIKDPNKPKPMALMMRQMAANADSMKAKLLRGESLDSLSFPFIRFYLVEPTDKNVLEPQFFENAKVYQAAHKAIFDHPESQKKYYNLMIGACISCHENYCSGPLRRIKKMPIID
jgi:cytochrome c553